MSYELESEDNIEENLGNGVATLPPSFFESSAVNGNNGHFNASNAELLDAVGLDAGDLKHVLSIPSTRVVSPNDVFCNRELKMSGIRAVGFDMDYTL